MVKAFVDALSPDAPTARDAVVTREFGFAAWLARLQFSVPTVFTNESLAGLLQLDDLAAGFVIHVRRTDIGTGVDVKRTSAF